MTELRTGQLIGETSFFTTSAKSARQSEGTDGFMQSLKQTGAISDSEQTAVKTPSSSAPKAEKPVESVSADSGADFRETSPTGKIKIDEKAVKELNDLRGSASEETDAVTVSGGLDGLNGGENSSEQDSAAALSGQENAIPVKSLTEQAREALENAIIKAFMELKDPDKQQEEFEEKLLLFLMKLVDGINGKTDKKSPLTSDAEDEDEKKIGGTLMEIIDSMLENAAKNAEMNGDQTAKSDVSFIGDYFLNLEEAANVEESELTLDEFGIQPKPAIKAVEPQLYPERENIFGRGERIGIDPVIPPVQTQSQGSEAAADSAGNTVTAENTADAAAIDPIHTEETVRGSENASAAVNRSNASLKFVGQNGGEQAENGTGLPVTEQAGSLEKNFGANVGNENGGYAQNTANLTETVSEAPVGAAFDNAVKTAEGLAKPEAAELSVGAAQDEAAVLETAAGAAVNKAVPAGEANGLEAPVPVISEDNSAYLYEQIALNVYSDVKSALKASYAEKTAVTVSAPFSEDSAVVRTENTETENELDELARLFGLRKEETRPLTEGSEEDNSEASASFGGNTYKGTEKNDENIIRENIFGADISITSVKPAEAPIPRTLPTGGSVSRVVTQIVNQILANIPEQGQETTLTVTLNPETLGKISLKLVENAGRISVTVTAESRETAAILASRAENVQESMRDQGTQLEKYQVVYGAEQDGRADQQNYEGSSKNPYVRDTEAESEDSEGEFEKILFGEI